MSSAIAKPDYGVDAPGAMRALFLFGLACLAVALLAPQLSRATAVLVVSRILYWPAGFLIAEGLLFFLYVRYGKFRQRDLLLGLHAWRGDELVLDVGCGRGLLLADAAKRIAQLNGTGHVTGIDLWSNVDMGGNSAAATQRNLELEGIPHLCTLVSMPAQDMPFPDASFDLIVSNLCLHNISDRDARRRAVAQIARVLKPGGTAILSDFKFTGQYASQLRELGLSVRKRRGGIVTAFAWLTVVIAQKPA
ncbi:class I SAM-dependent methyltransferase [Acidobacteria bacterium AB60]|nr:class I SAM-dependent methyltransferase [Acidobacteria bacterium AB60]